MPRLESTGAGSHIRQGQKAAVKLDSFQQPLKNVQELFVTAHIDMMYKLPLTSLSITQGSLTD